MKHPFQYGVDQAIPYYLPQIKRGTMQINGQFQDDTVTGDSVDGRMGLYGLDPFRADTNLITCTHVMGPDFLGSPVPAGVSLPGGHYQVGEEGIDEALFDFARFVLDGPEGLMSFIPVITTGAQPRPGIYDGSYYSGGSPIKRITNWTMFAQVAQNYQVVHHPNGEISYCEITVTYMCKGSWITVNFTDASSTIVRLS